MKKVKIVCILMILFLPVMGQETENALVSRNGVSILPEQGDFAIGIDAVPFLNLFNDKGNEPGFNFTNNLPAISGKYFLTGKSALRASVRIGYSKKKDGDEDLTDFIQYTDADLNFTLGYEKRLGKSRVQGFYGAEVGLFINKTKSEQNTVIFWDKKTFGTGIAGLIGAEYFIFPKLSVGGQFTWGIVYQIEKDKENEERTNTFDMDVANNGGALMLIFHF